MLHFHDNKLLGTKKCACWSVLSWHAYLMRRQNTPTTDEEAFRNLKRSRFLVGVGGELSVRVTLRS